MNAVATAGLDRSEGLLQAVTNLLIAQAAVQFLVLREAHDHVFHPRLGGQLDDRIIGPDAVFQLDPVRKSVNQGLHGFFAHIALTEGINEAQILAKVFLGLLQSDIFEQSVHTSVDEAEGSVKVLDSPTQLVLIAGNIVASKLSGTLDR